MAPFHSARERTALAGAEAVTRVATHDLPDALDQEVHAQFDDKAIVDLTMAIIGINGWSRLAVGFRAEPGSYQATPAAKFCLKTRYARDNVAFDT